LSSTAPFRPTLICGSFDCYDRLSEARSGSIFIVYLWPLFERKYRVDHRDSVGDNKCDDIAKRMHGFRRLDVLLQQRMEERGKREAIERSTKANRPLASGEI
jgi:hypothetical protein